MKILHLIDIPWWSGLSAYAFDCMAAQISMGHEVRLLCEKNSLPYKKAKELGISVTSMGGRKFWNAPGNFMRIGQALGPWRPALLVAHTGSTHWMAALWGSWKKIPVIRTRALAQPVKKNWVNRAVYENSKWVLTASEKLRRDCRLSLDNGAQSKIRALLPPVENPALLSAGPLQAGVPRNKKIGVLARLDPKKGHRTVLEALQILQSEDPSCELHIAGAEENLPWHEILRSAQAMNLKNVWYHGFLTAEQIWDFMKDCRLGVIASLGSEEVSRGLLEWMSVGRPVVATRVGCIPEILEEGRGGYLVQPGDAEALAEKIQILLGDFDLAQKMGQYNLEKVARDFTLAQFKAGWHALLYV